jgi:hypothetical protein
LLLLACSQLLFAGGRLLLLLLLWRVLRDCWQCVCCAVLRGVC